MLLAFDGAWGAIAARYGDDPAAITAARLTLAECVNIVTLDGSTDVADIKRLALSMLGVIEL